jgi:alkylation response protein AidB-like acyl-CoA dehydrogenase
MSLVLTEEQLMLRDSAHSFLSEKAPVAHLRELRDSSNADGFSRELWGDMADMGWPAILVPEAHGGLDYGYTGLGVILEECGRTLTPGPLLATALTGVTALNLAGTGEQCAAVLPEIASGQKFLALACDESARHEPDRVATEAEDLGGSFRLNGQKKAVVDGQFADTFIVSAWSGAGVSLFLVPANSSGLTIERVPALDTHVMANVVLNHVEVPADNLLGKLDGGQELLDRILDATRIGQSAELLGIAQEAFERTMDYLKERKQFGVPIGGFQALQHRAAALFGEIELCKSVVLKALQELDSGTGDLAETASLAKAKASEVAHLAATEAIQMHGGIGVTDDFDIGFFLKRCRVLESLYGDRYFHLDRYARLRGY